MATPLCAANKAPEQIIDRGLKCPQPTEAQQHHRCVGFGIQNFMNTRQIRFDDFFGLAADLSGRKQQDRIAVLKKRMDFTQRFNFARGALTLWPAFGG